MEPNKASPSLRSCYAVTDEACCNFVQDNGITGKLDTIIPSACEGDHKNELKLLSCLGCRGEGAFKYTIKAEATGNYL
jgi:hypothetical protein